MSTIWKYNFAIEDTFSLAMPPGATVLTVQVQHGIPCIWALIHDPLAPPKEYAQRKFILVGTGSPFVHCVLMRYVGTFQLENGSLAFHLWEDCR